MGSSICLFLRSICRRRQQIPSRIPEKKGQILFFPIHLPRAFPQSPSILGPFRNLIYELANRRPPRFNKWRCRCLSIYNLQSGRGGRRKEGLLISLLLLPSSRRSWLGRKYPRFSTLSWEFGKLLLMGKPSPPPPPLYQLFGQQLLLPNSGCGGCGWARADLIYGGPHRKEGSSDGRKREV